MKQIIPVERLDQYIAARPDEAKRVVNRARSYYDAEANRRLLRYLLVADSDAYARLSRGRGGEFAKIANEYYYLGCVLKRLSAIGALSADLERHHYGILEGALKDVEPEERQQRLDALERIDGALHGLTVTGPGRRR